MDAAFDINNLNWLWRRLEGGAPVEGWAGSSEGQFDCIVRTADGASWRRHRGFGIWAAAPAKAAAPARRIRRRGPRTSV